MGSLSTDLSAAPWVSKLINDVLWRLNQFHGQPVWTAVSTLDFASLRWQVKFRCDGRAGFILQIPDEYELDRPELRFDEMMVACRAADGKKVDVSRYANSRSLTTASTPALPQVGDVMTVNGQQVRIVSVNPDDMSATCVPVGVQEQSLDLYQSPAEAARLKAEEEEALEIMREALRHT